MHRSADTREGTESTPRTPGLAELRERITVLLSGWASDIEREAEAPHAVEGDIPAAYEIADRILALLGAAPPMKEPTLREIGLQFPEWVHEIDALAARIYAGAAPGETREMSEAEFYAAFDPSCSDCNANTGSGPCWNHDPRRTSSSPIIIDTCNLTPEQERTVMRGVLKIRDSIRGAAPTGDAARLATFGCVECPECDYQFYVDEDSILPGTGSAAAPIGEAVVRLADALADALEFRDETLRAAVNRGALDSCALEDASLHRAAARLLRGER